MTSQIRSLSLCMIVFLIFAFSVGEGIYVGATRTLPGALARHTSAIAVAVSCLSYGHCTGFTSYLAVDKTLFDEGLNYNAVGTTGGEIYHDHELIDRAITKAASLSNVAGSELVSMGPHEKGLSVFYLISMAVFGIHLSSLFYGFMFIFLVSIVAFALAFHRDLVAMLCLVGASCAMALVIPVVQHINIDVNSVHGSRYLPLLALVPTMHMILSSERYPNNRRGIPTAAIQAALLFLVIFARLSGAWMLAAIALWIAGRVSYRIFFDRKKSFFPASQSATMVACVAVALIGVPKIALDESYLEQDQTEYRTFWHHLLVAANFNPYHAQITGLPTDEGYDDLVAYRLFEQEVARRGENLSSYLIEDETNWRLRTPERKYDYKWGLYEGIVKTVFLRQLVEHPFYVASSFLIFEPVAIAKQLFAGYFLPPLAAILIAALFVLAAGFVLAGAEISIPPLLVGAALLFLIMSLLPAEASGVMPLRLVEPAFIFYFVVISAATLAVSRITEMRRNSVLLRLRPGE